VHRSSIVLVTPALADANNGNWQTARRWARMLSRAYHVALATRWQGGAEDLMVALHARRSSAAVLAWREAHPRRPLLLALTGTDLYRDIDTDADARACLGLADALVVLNERGGRRLPAALRARCHVVLQSCSLRATVPKPRSRLRAVMVGHLRAEKDPETFFRAARLLAGRPDILLDHVGSALDPGLGKRAAALARQQPAYRWLGALPHEATRRRIQSAHVLVNTSRMEGGAHVVIEALRSGTPVIASRIDGNVGLLGAGYPGLFPVGDEAALARLLCRARDEPAFLKALQERAAARAPLFTPEAEARKLVGLVEELLRR
jgi:putative glycosyltransferase (TIGR04348 family)